MSRPNPNPADHLDDDLLLPDQLDPEEAADPTLPEDCPLDKLHRKRVAQGRDLTILVADWNLERGSGKTTLALQLAHHFDRTEAGLTTDKTTLSAEELTQAYTSEPTRSALVLDEGQAAASNRRAMSGINEALRQIVGMGRVEEKYLLLTAPGVHMTDKDIRNMCDVWLFVTELGSAEMFRVRYNPFGQHEMTDHWGTLHWDANLPDPVADAYDDLTAEKRRRLRGQGHDGQGYVDPEEAADRAQSAAEEAERQTRDQLLRDIYQNTQDMTQQELADAVGLSRSRIADVVAGD